MATSLLTLLRQAIATELTNDLGIRVEPGRITGPVAERVACIYPGGREEFEEDVQRANVELAIRSFHPYAEQFEPTRPFDPALLEGDAQTIIESLRDKQFEELGVPGVWFVRVISETYDFEEQSVECIVRAFTDNPFTP